MSPDYLEGHVFLAACYSLMGRDGEATAAAKEILDRNPKFNIASYAKRLTFSFNIEADIERVLDVLRKIGLPEKSTS